MRLIIRKMRAHHPPAFKAKAALEALKGDRTSSEMASKYQVHPNQIRNWKSIAVNGITELFNGKRQRQIKRRKNSYKSYTAR